MSHTLTADACAISQWRCTPTLTPAQHRAVCRAMALDGFKWDSQVGDITTLAPFAIVLPRQIWRELVGNAETLASELAAMEGELTRRSDLWPELGLPSRLLRALRRDEPWTPAAARVLRFDFHPTSSGWAVSEVNSDVPGGYAETTTFARLMAQHVDRVVGAGDPTAALCEALIAGMSHQERIALLAAPGYTEDLQVIAHLAAALTARGAVPLRIRPEQLTWRNGRACVKGARGFDPLAAIFRFYQGEWMPRLAGDEWRFLFRGGHTPVCNPGSALLTESKRLPVLWSELSTRMPTWQQLSPATAQSHAAWRGGDWVLKASYSNNGDAVLARRWSSGRDYAWAFVQGLVARAQWTAQRRFESLRLATPLGSALPCLGVYVVNGRAVGIYGRLAIHAVVDYRAVDAAVLIEESER